MSDLGRWDVIDSLAETSRRWARELGYYFSCEEDAVIWEKMLH